MEFAVYNLIDSLITFDVVTYLIKFSENFLNSVCIN